MLRMANAKRIAKRLPMFIGPAIGIGLALMSDDTEAAMKELGHQMIDPTGSEPMGNAELPPSELAKSDAHNGRIYSRNSGAKDFFANLKDQDYRSR